MAPAPEHRPAPPASWLGGNGARPHHEPAPDDGIQPLPPGEGEALHTVAPPHDLSPIGRFDNEINQLFDRLRGKEPFDRIFYAATELGDFGLIWLLLGGLKALRSERDFQAGIRLFACLG